MPEYLPPIITRLEGDISPLAAKLAEAEKLVDEYGRNVEKTAKAHGEAAGEAGGKGLTDKLEAELDKPTVAERPLSKMADKVEAKWKEIGEKSGKDFAAGIEQETKSLEARLTQLASDFVSSGDFDLFKQYRQAKDDLGVVSKVRKEFDGIRAEASKLEQDLGGDAGGAGGGFLSKVFGTPGALLGKLPAPEGFTQWLVYGAVAAAPAIGAAINSAVLLGVGGGGLALGLMAAAHDARVKDAYSGLFSDVGRKLEDASGPLVGPLLRGADKFSAEVDKIMPGVERAFERAAPTVDHLVDGVVGLVDKVGPGLGRAFDAALPMLDQLASDLPRLGSAMSSFFDSIASGGPGATMFFHDLMMLLDGSIVLTGKLVEGMSKAWELSQKIPGAGGLLQYLGDLVPAGDKGKKALDDVGKGGENASRGIDDAKKSLSDFISEALRMQDTDLAIDKGLLDVADAFQQNGSSLDTNTQKGLANREALQHQIETIAQWRQQQLDAHKSTAYVNSVVDEQITKMYNAAAAHGADKKALQDLITQWRTMLDLPSNKAFTTTFTTIDQRIDRGSIASPTGNKRAQRYGGIVRHAAEGLITRPGIYAGRGDGFTVMAEQPTREEGYVPRDGISAPDAYGLLSTMASWRGWSLDTGGEGGASYAPSAAAGAVAAGGTTTQVLQLVVDGRVFFEQVVLPYAQQFKLNNGYSGT